MRTRGINLGRVLLHPRVCLLEPMVHAILFLHNNIACAQNPADSLFGLHSACALTLGSRSCAFSLPTNPTRLDKRKPLACGSQWQPDARNQVDVVIDSVWWQPDRQIVREHALVPSEGTSMLESETSILASPPPTWSRRLWIVALQLQGGDDPNT
jgi:hypothetical protein